MATNSTDNKDWKVVGFDINEYDIKALNRRSDNAKYDLYLADETYTRCWDCPQDFFNDLNDEQVDTENMYYFLIAI